MRFTVELYVWDTDGHEAVVDRRRVSAITPLGAQREASQGLVGRKAKGVRLLNAKGDIIWRTENA